MKEATGNALVMQWVIFFIFLLLITLVGSLIYSRTFKIRNEVISIIENHKGYNDQARDEIHSFMAATGYRREHDFRGETLRERCEQREDVSEGWTYVDSGSDFFYCVYEHQYKSLYRVEVYLHLDFPVIGRFLAFPARGETKSFAHWES